LPAPRPREIDMSSHPEPRPPQHPPPDLQLVPDAVHAYEDVAGSLGGLTEDILEMRRKTAVIKRRGWLMRRMLLAADVVGLATAFLLVQVLMATGTDPGRIPRMSEILAFLCALPVWIFLAKVYGLYARDEERTDHSTLDELVGVFHLVTVGVWLTFVASWVAGLAHPNVDKVIAFWFVTIALVTLGRTVARTICRRTLTYFQNTVIVGTGEVAQDVAAKYLSRSDHGVNLVGFVDDDPRPLDGRFEDVPVLGGIKRLPLLARVLDVERVVIAFSPASDAEMVDLISSLKDLDVQVDIVPRLFEVLGPSLDVHMVQGLPLIGLPPLRLTRSSLIVKRAMDIVLSAFGLVVLAPLIAVLALAIKLDSRGPVLYRAVRVGKGGRLFRQLKFRTMRLEFCRGGEYGGSDAETVFEELMQDPQVRAEFERTHKLENDPRVTRVGRVLRRWSLDELPQLLNVLRGDLSLVGPRPVATDEYSHLGLDDLTESNGDAFSRLRGPRRLRTLRGYWEIRHLRPGLTGYWQVSGRSSVDHAERIGLDMAYVTSWSLTLDLKIIAKTLRVMGSGHGAF
jgi:lipopolysaccharide/colanic/teichoic acid biosynthesis glycosyltransferase